MRGVKACSKRSSAISSLALLLLLIVIIVLSQGGVTSRAERDSGDLISLNVQAIKIRDPTNDPYKWPPPIVEEIKLDDGRVLKLNLWGFIIRAPLPTEERGISGSQVGSFSPNG